MAEPNTASARQQSLFGFDEAWLKGHREEILEPELAIVDPHHHLWDRGSRYLLDEFRADLGSGHNIRATVFVQCDAMYRADGDPDLAPVGAGQGSGARCAFSRRGGRPGAGSLPQTISASRRIQGR